MENIEKILQEGIEKAINDKYCRNTQDVLSFLYGYLKNDYKLFANLLNIIKEKTFDLNYDYENQLVDNVIKQFIEKK